jgi:MoxR-like ATPase
LEEQFLEQFLLIRDLLESEKSILILGKPGVGKTTIIREIARVLADEMEKRVIIIDTQMKLLVIVIFHILELVEQDECKLQKLNYNIKL